MKKHSAIFIFLAFVLFVSCSSSNSSNDSDIIPDSDDIETVDNDSDTQEAEIVDDSDEKPDQDNDSDTEKSDSDDCQPPLSEAQFPYYDANGKITFCRPGCDTPTAEDPICIGNLWDEQNDALCHEYPEYACCGTPCILESLKPMTKEEVNEMYTVANTAMHKCDLKISPWSWVNDSSNGVVKAWNMSERKVGFQIYPTKTKYEQWPSKRKHITYNIDTKQYSLVIPSQHQEQAYHKGKRLALISDKRNLDLNNSSIFLAYIGDDGKVEIVYDKKVKSISYEPALNEKWAFVNLVDSNGKRMLYAKVGEWKWTSLGNGLGWEPNIVGNSLALVDDNVNGWVCDLSKYPKSLSDCKKVNRDGEEVRGIRINKENENQFIYNSNFTKLIYLELKEDKFAYKDLITDFTAETDLHKYSLWALQFWGNTLLFEEVTDFNGVGGGLICYYRLDKNKKYCMKKMEKDETYSDGTTVFPYSFGEFDGNWLLYQKRSSTPLILRNMECYCREESICPFEQ